MTLIDLCKRAAQGDAEARKLARELEEALIVLSTYDEGPDLVLYYKYLLELQGDDDYKYHFNQTDSLSASQREFAQKQFELFQNWWAQWEGKTYVESGSLAAGS